MTKTIGIPPTAPGQASEGVNQNQSLKLVLAGSVTETDPNLDFAYWSTDPAGNNKVTADTCVEGKSGTVTPSDFYAHFNPSTTLTVAPATGTYGGTTSLSATLKKKSDSSTVSGKTINFTLNGNSVGSAPTNGSGVATLSNGDLSGINVGTYSTGVGASFTADDNYGGSSGTASLSVGKADTTTKVTCPASVTYTGSALEPCSAKVTGPGGLDQNLTVSYQNNTNVGTATASASYAGMGNYAASSDSTTFAIGKADTTTTVTCPASVTYTGSAHTPCSASVSGPNNLNQPLTVSYSNNVIVGTATASANYAETANYKSSTGSKTFELIAKPVISSSGSRSLTDVGPGRILERLEALPAEPLGRRAFGARALREPPRPVGPPGPGRLRGARQPRLGVFGQLVVDPVGRLRVAGRVDQRGDVPAR